MLKDIIELSATDELAAEKIAVYFLRQQLERTQREIRDGFSMAVNSCRGVLNPEQIARYQSIWSEFDDLVAQVRL